ncbi:MAG: GTP cyclohydrolase I, partial [Muribaculaceae bacterium]|nr:GTP cyclohydrolase I [Muribaculaceae bacterium]
MTCNYDESTVNAVASHIEEIIRLLGENPDREGLKKTPLRAAKALYYITNGYRTNVDDVVNGDIFSHD